MCIPNLPPFFPSRTREGTFSKVCFEVDFCFWVSRVANAIWVLNVAQMTTTNGTRIASHIGWERERERESEGVIWILDQTGLTLFTTATTTTTITAASSSSHYQCRFPPPHLTQSFVYCDSEDRERERVRESWKLEHRPTYVTAYSLSFSLFSTLYATRYAHQQQQHLVSQSVCVVASELAYPEWEWESVCVAVVCVCVCPGLESIGRKQTNNTIILQEHPCVCHLPDTLTAVA